MPKINLAFKNDTPICILMFLFYHIFHPPTKNKFTPYPGIRPEIQVMVQIVPNTTAFCHFGAWPRNPGHDVARSACNIVISTDTVRHTNHARLDYNVQLNPFSMHGANLSDVFHDELPDGHR